MSGEFVLGRPPQTDDELYWLIQAMWGVRIPRVQVCPDHVAPFTAFADAYFGRNSIEPDSPVDSISLWHGSRGLSGKSFMLSILGLTKTFLRGADCNLLGGSYAQSVNIHEHMRNAMDYKNAPAYMVADNLSTQVKLTNGAKIRPLTASQRTVRGPHPPLLLLDEIDEMELAILDGALGQPLPQKNWLGEFVDPYTVMCSTWQNAQGTFTEMLKRCEEQGIPIYRWCYRESANPVDGWLTQKAIEEKKRVINKEMWRVEYELGEPSIGNRAFDSEAVERVFSLPFEPLEKQEAKDYEEYTFALPERDGTYVCAADWAKEQDYTVISVIRIDRKPFELCYWAKFNRRPYPFMIDKFNKAMARYNAQGEYDRTGLGNVVADYIDVRAHGFMMTGDKRAAMLSEYVNAVERPGTFAFPKIPSAHIAHKYAQVGDLYSSSKEYHLPDEVCSLALAFYRAERSVPVASPILVPRAHETNRYAKVFDTPTENRVEGEVSSSAEADRSMSLLV